MTHDDTLDFYNQHAACFFADTLGVEMGDLYEKFLPHIPKGGLILDAGCGSGRDSRAFIELGYRVVSFDASRPLAELASTQIGQPVEVRSFNEVEETACYDGIWACASLLHLPASDIPTALARLWRALKPGGMAYLSFKFGETERIHQGRHFTDATEDRLRVWVEGLPDIDQTECWITPDQRPDRNENWLNVLIPKKTAHPAKLITGGREHPFLPQLCAAINHANEIDLAVAFIKMTGLRMLLPDLQMALSRGTAPTQNKVRLRIVTSDYLDVTDPEALRLMMLLQEQGAQIKVYETANSSFHMKAYLFAHFCDSGHLHGTGFIGSSNISRQALTDGLEWNYRIDFPGDDGFLEARTSFEALFANHRCRPLSHEWIDSYESRRKLPERPIEAGSNELDPPPLATPIQVEALAALDETRRAGYRRGLVVLATGLGKTWLAAFDAVQMNARRVLFVAHREEILIQAAATFLRIRPTARIGFYTGQQRDNQVDILCASVQTLSKIHHLKQFAQDHFDYVVIDEFHHAAAPTYRALLSHFSPRFLLGLTATPDRTDQSDILSFCDDNLVFTTSLFEGIAARLLAPFHYYGILDDTVNYGEIPWRNGKFDPEQLSSKLATLARARHALRLWREKALKRTLAFCVSILHAEFMAKQFTKEGIAAAPVYAGSTISRGEALQQLADGRLQIIFSVDLFNEGVDLPGIDTVMMLRPTESKILFLQQLGRGLRVAEGKTHLVILDFIGNHRSFLHKPQALANLGASYRELARFARQVENHALELPDGCFINYDLGFIDFLKSLDSDGISNDYDALKAALGRRPTLAEFHRSGASLLRMRQQYDTWFSLVREMGDLPDEEAATIDKHRNFLAEIETTAMTKCFKMILLEAFQEMDGWSNGPTLASLASRSLEVLRRRCTLLVDLPDGMQEIDAASTTWQRYWRNNPVNAWIGGNTSSKKSAHFRLDGERFKPAFEVTPERIVSLSTLTQELIDYRFATYESRLATIVHGSNVIPFPQPTPHTTLELPFFPDLKIACGHFRTSSTDAVEHRGIPPSYGRLDPSRHFIARARGNSMDGGKQPIKDGDYLLLELIHPGNAGSITGSIVAIERQDDAGDNQFLLRVVTKTNDGQYILKANNPDYADLPATDEMRTLARLKRIIDPLDLAVGHSFLREDIPPLFGEVFNPGNWHSGHVVLNANNAHILLVTLNKQGKAADHRYLDHWIDETTFHWQSQNSTTPDGKRGKEIIEQEKLGISIHLFVRERKLAGGTAAPFTYFGQVRYRSHTGSEPMSVIFELIK